MLVQRDDALARVNSDDTLTPLEVIIADDKYFCVGECYEDEHGQMMTSFERIAIYDNTGTAPLEDTDLIRL